MRNLKKIPVRLDLVRSDLYRLVRDRKLNPNTRIAAARVLLQYPPEADTDSNARANVERLIAALKNG